MKLGTLKNDTRDGALLVVSKNLKHAVVAYEVAPTLQAAFDDWDYIAPQLRQLYDDLNRAPGPRAFELDPRQLCAPLPRAYQWLDASAYLPHVELVRKARGAAMPAELKKDPLMYQGDSDYFIGPCDPIEAANEDWGIDLEAELAAFLGDVPMGVKPDRAGDHIRLLALANDVSLRELIPAELAKGLGFLHGKGATAFSPVAVTPDEFGDAWDGKKVRLPVTVHINDRQLGAPDCGTDMQFDFPHLIAHAAKTRRLGAGSVLGSGTISNHGHESGHACIAEIRALETVREGKPVTSYLKFGDRVKIEMFDAGGQSIFGAIDQQVVQYAPPR
ncbi:MAG: fumarylacetoacetate hydrolase family protein [Betaproteobacteria bacterium]|nr:MAG: fumarylacetoacetate hydrolase family protein [Betaproteobacteria bacterium]